ncbi:hypothetical protein [Streptosporangium album]|nr:hypothetical protein [Streptosporangium album]
MKSCQWNLIAVAWRSGERNIRALARAVGISRDIIYADRHVLCNQ